ncbi:K(+) efflux antiporter 2, chloroplastic-like [Tripterygium wilfordii]|uniref:K(+) efflux antiporter 2, chloroplastic-like n=1 Tax=Tripterygium wilfordii TaxID=458696 RepID=UPI0018F82AA3|nr:K(+) efflux antiporter 2, chloroplastic-like [Tripterygium wilfordii]XP_038682685.1 K(+) efflux antiporter 2, chloroplastic-like [Tripterygium wilfordii]
MDFMCSIRHGDAFQLAEGSSYRMPAQIPSRFGNRNFGYNPTVVSIARSMKKMRSTGYSGYPNSSLVLRTGFGSHLRGLYPDRTLYFRFDTSLKVLRGVRHQCKGGDSLAYIDGGNGRKELVGNSDGSIVDSVDGAELDGLVEVERAEEKEEIESPSLDELKEILQRAMTELDVAQLNSIMFEEKAQSVSEASIALKDETANAWDDVNKTLDVIQEIVNQECVAKETVQKARMAHSLAEARLQVAVESLEAAKGKQGSPQPVVSGESETENDAREEEEALLAAQDVIKECQTHLESCEAELTRLKNKKEELQKEVDKLNEIVEKAQMDALKAEEEVANIMLLAEQAVAFELEAMHRVNDAQIALQRVEKSLSNPNNDMMETAHQQVLGEEAVVEEEKAGQASPSDVRVGREKEIPIHEDVLDISFSSNILSDKSIQAFEDFKKSDDFSDHENGQPGSDSPKEAEIDSEKLKSVAQTKKLELQKESTLSSPLNTPKALLKKSSRFFSASFFSSDVEGTEFTPASLLYGLMESAKKQLPKLVLGFFLFGAGVALYANRTERSYQLLQQADVMTTSIEEVSSNANSMIQRLRKFPKKFKTLLANLPQQEINEEEASLFDMLWLLLASVVFVPIFQKIPGGSPVLGYLAAGILIGPYGLSIIRHVHGTKAIAEFGVVFLLFNIGLELSVERLSSMKKYVFGLGSAQVLVTAVAVGAVAHFFGGQPGPAAIVIGNGLALSSTAVVLQVLQERGESTSRHGRATFSVLLFQDLAVVVLLILIPLISPNSSKGGVGFQAIAEALGLAAVKAAVAITAIIAGGRLLLRPIYKQIAENQNAEIFSANTLLVILGTSLLTARAGLSMALGAFLAGLLLAETEFSLQVESDIAPYRGLLLGLFFMTVGMSIDPKLLFSNFPVIMGTLGLLIGGKTMLVALVGRIFGISLISAIRTGLLLAPGGEFAFVAFGDAVNQGIMSSHLSSLLFLVVGISMALTPWLAAGGQLIASRFELHDVRSLLPVESETDDLQDHIIICGFGRAGQIIAQLLSERLIPFVALDVKTDRVTMGRSLDLPVYFGDAGSREVLHKVGAERACAAAIALDTPGANYRTVWALSKYFPNVKTFVRAHDVDHGLNLEKAGATAVVPETLEPSLQLAAAVLAQAKLPTSEIAAAINEFRSRHLSELTELCQASGSSLGYGFSRIMSKSKSQSSDSSDDDQITEGTLAI